MDITSLQDLMDCLSQDLPLNEIAPPFLLASAIDYITDTEKDDEQKALVDSICERYWSLCDAEISDALSLYSPSSPDDSMTFSTVYIDAYGHLVSGEDDYGTAISLATFGETEGDSSKAVHQLALSVHQHRAATARELEEAVEEQREQDEKNRILNQPDRDNI